MQESENRFFRYVWRFNALAIAVATTICGLLGLYAGFSIFGETRPSRPANFVKADVQDKVSEEYWLGTPGVTPGTSFVRIPLFRGPQSYGPSSLRLKSGGARSVVDLLFLNIANNESRWLFNGVGQLIVEERSLFNKLREFPDQPRTAVGVIYTVVEKDSNGDSRLTEEDAVSLATSAVDGSGYRKLIEGIDQLHSVQQVSDDKVLVLYQKGQQIISELYSVPAMAPLSQVGIPKVNLN